MKRALLFFGLFVLVSQASLCAAAGDDWETVVKPGAGGGSGRREAEAVVAGIGGASGSASVSRREVKHAGRITVMAYQDNQKLLGVKRRIMQLDCEHIDTLNGLRRPAGLPDLRRPAYPKSDAMVTAASAITAPYVYCFVARNEHNEVIGFIKYWSHRLVPQSHLSPDEKAVFDGIKPGCRLTAVQGAVVEKFIDHERLVTSGPVIDSRYDYDTVAAYLFAAIVNKFSKSERVILQLSNVPEAYSVLSAFLERIGFERSPADAAWLKHFKAYACVIAGHLSRLR